MPLNVLNRTFKTARFFKDAKKAKIKDSELCLVIQQVLLGQVDAKKNRENIESDELLAFRLLASSYAGLTVHQVEQLLVNGDFVEICHDDKTEIQK